MPANFNWQAEDDSSWDEYTQPGVPGKPGRPVNRRLIAAVFTVIVVAISAIFITRQLREYVADTESTVETDILTSQDLVIQAAGTSDPELLVSVLSGRDAEWTSAILTLLDKELLFDRRQFGLEWQEDILPSDIDITLAADLNSAELKYTLVYAIDMGSADEEQVALQQTVIFRTSEDRWLLSPPLDEFWGDRITAQGRFVSVEFPERDAELGRRLAADLEATIGMACNSLPDLDCPDDFRLQITLTRDPSVLLDLADPVAGFDKGQDLVLPTPTLLGLPTDEDGYRTLKRIYEIQAVTRIINDLSHWSCCSQALIYQALMDLQLAELGVGIWPADPGDYLDALRRRPSLQQLAQLWDQTQPDELPSDNLDQWLVYSLIEFLSNERIGTSALSMQNALEVSTTFDEWLGTINHMNMTDEYIDQAWNNYLMRRIDAWQASPPAPLPAQNIAMICDEGIVGSSNLYVYDLDRETWELAMTNREFVHMGSVPGGRGILLSDQLIGPDQMRTLVWSERAEIIVDEGHQVYRLTGLQDPLSGAVVLRGYDSQTLSGGHFILDIDNCTTDDCSPQPVPGYLQWSPDGGRSIYVDPAEDQAIVIGDSEGNFPVSVGQGRDPFWIGENTFGFLKVGDQPSIVTMTVDSDNSHELVTSLDISRIITDTQAADISLLRVASQPSDPHNLVITAGNHAGDKIYLIAYDWQHDIFSKLFVSDVPASGLVSVSFSPDGAWLLIKSPAGMRDGSVQEYNVFLFDMSTGEMQELLPVLGTNSPATDWSADSRWLLQLVDGRVILTAPEDDYQHLILHGLRSCRGAAWTEMQ